MGNPLDDPEFLTHLADKSAGGGDGTNSYSKGELTSLYENMQKHKKAGTGSFSDAPLPKGTRSKKLPTKIYEVPPDLNPGETLYADASPGLPANSRAVHLPTQITEVSDEVFQPDPIAKQRRQVLDPIVREAMQKRLVADEKLQRSGVQSSKLLDNKSRNDLLARLREDRRMQHGENYTGEQSPANEMPSDAFRRINERAVPSRRPELEMVRMPDGTMMAKRSVDQLGLQTQAQSVRAARPDPIDDPGYFDDVQEYLKD